MSEREFEVVPPPPDPLASGVRDLAALDPFGLRAPAAPYQPRSAQRAWTSLMHTVGRKVPNHLGWSLRYRNAMMTLARRRSRL